MAPVLGCRSSKTTLAQYTRAGGIAFCGLVYIQWRRFLGRNSSKTRLVGGGEAGSGGFEGCVMVHWHRFWGEGGEVFIFLCYPSQISSQPTSVYTQSFFQFIYIPRLNSTLPSFPPLSQNCSSRLLACTACL